MSVRSLFMWSWRDDARAKAPHCHAGLQNATDEWKML